MPDLPVVLFPLADAWWLYGLFTLFVLAVLALDLGVFHREAHEVSYKEAAAWSAVWVVLSLGVCLALYLYARDRFAVDARLLATPGFRPDAAARQVALEFLTGWIIEKALSVDNIFVFVVVFSFFGIPAKYQHRILFWGILGALFFRAVFIGLGAVLLSVHWVLYLFGAFLILTGVKLFFSSDEPVDPSKNPAIGLVRRFFPLTDGLRGSRFLVREGGALRATPLLLTLVTVEVTDVIFAIDSVPAIFAVTKEPFVVFTSNICAILGLRALYFLLAGAVGKFHLLKYGLGLVLVFVGLKMVWLNDAFGGTFPIAWSLAIIAATIGGAIALSLLVPPRGETSAP